MKKIFTLLIILAGISSLSIAQNISRLEYFVDSDPGFGIAKQVTINPSPDIDISFQINLTDVTEGFHQLFLRGKDTNGKWSLPYWRYIIKFPLAIGESPKPIIKRVEYFFDNDPGFGNGFAVSASQDTNIIVDFTTPITQLAEGFHQLFVRAVDANGKWSLCVWRYLLKLPTKPAEPDLPKIIRAEYYVDNDPGFGNGTKATFTSSTDAVIDFSVAMNQITEGFHQLFVRGLDANGKWSLSYWRYFVKLSIPEPATLANVNKLEYFVDSDPGFGKGIPVTMTNSTDVIAEFVVDMNNLSEGFHQLFVRGMDANGKWSDYYWRYFVKQTLATPETLADIKSIQYYFTDATTSTQKYNYNSFTPANDVYVKFNASLVGLTVDNKYTMHIAGFDSKGKLGIEHTELIKVVEQLSDLAITSPNGGEKWLINSIQEIKWTSNHVATVKLEYSTNNGGSWTEIANTITASLGKYVWTIPDASSSQCIIRITDEGNGMSADVSDNSFTIYKKILTVVKPNGGEFFDIGSSEMIRWNSDGVDNIKVEYSIDSGSSWSLVTTTTPAKPGAFLWTPVPNTPSANCLIKLTNVDDATLNDASNSTFNIQKLFNWKVNINFASSSGEKGYLQFGQSKYGSNGLDYNLGEVNLPPVPPTEVFDSRFELPVSPKEYTANDFRGEEENSEWIVRLQAVNSTYPITVTWDNTKLPEGSLLITDTNGGSIINVDMKSVGSLSISNTTIKSLKIIFSKSSQKEIVVSKGWNMLGIPVTGSNMTVASLFPTATSSAFEYIPSSGYNVVTSFQVSKGYWLKFGETTKTKVFGSPPAESKISVASGWNMISGFDKNISVSQISTNPQNIISSALFGYSDSYQICDTMKIGKGYWIKTNQAGELILNSSGLPKISCGILAKREIDANWKKLFICDSENKQTVLFIAEQINNELTLPPPPPNGVFDVRWENDSKVICLSETGKVLVINSATYPITITNEGESLRIKDRIGGKLVNVLLGEGRSFTISNPAIQRLEIYLEKIPTSFNLMQNYPNPFNPETVISYQISTLGRVTLIVYDVLGREIAKLVDDVQEPGTYHSRFNTETYSLSSGVYFYRLQCQGYTSIKKMLLIK